MHFGAEMDKVYLDPGWLQMKKKIVIFLTRPSSPINNIIAEL